MENCNQFLNIKMNCFSGNIPTFRYVAMSRIQSVSAILISGLIFDLKGDLHLH